MKSFLITILLSVVAVGAWAQSSGTVTVYQGSDIDKVLNAKRNKQKQEAPKPVETKPATPAQTEVTPKVERSVEAEEHTAKQTKLVQKRVLVKIDDHSQIDRSVGFRIQVYSGGNTREARQEAERAGHKVKAAMPELPVYVHFYTPRWGCRVGNFRTYKEAQKVQKKIKKLGFKQAIILRKPGQLGEKKKYSRS